jgi:hypothetical protein
MCDRNRGCQEPDELEHEPKKCSPEQIEKCHGDVKDLSCVLQSAEG